MMKEVYSLLFGKGYKIELLFPANELLFAGFFGQFGVIKRLRISRNKKVKYARLKSTIRRLIDDITLRLWWQLSTGCSL